MQVVSVCSLKGGVGKTSVVLGLASAALHRGVNTLVVDMDPQGDATTGLDLAHREPNIADVLARPKRRVVRDAIVPCSWQSRHDSRLDVLTGGASAATFDEPEVVGPDADRLAQALDKLHGYELVLIDCPPSLGALTTMAWMASSRAVVVAEPSLFAVSAADRALRAIDALRRTRRPEFQPLGLVINKVRAQSVEHDYRLKELQELFGPLVLSPTLPDRAALQQAQGAAQPLHSWPSVQARELAADFDLLLARVLRANRARHVRSA